MKAKKLISLSLAFILMLALIPVTVLAGGGDTEIIYFENPQKLTLKINDERGKDTGIRVTIDKVYEKYTTDGRGGTIYVSPDATLTFNVDAYCYSGSVFEEFVVKANKPVSINEHDGYISFSAGSMERYGAIIPAWVFRAQDYCFESTQCKPISELTNDAEGNVPTPTVIDVSGNFLTNFTARIGLADETIGFSSVAEQYGCYSRNNGQYTVYIFFVEPGTVITFGKSVIDVEIAGESGREKTNWSEEFPRTEHKLTTKENEDYFTFIGGKSIEIRQYREPYNVSLNIRRVNGELRFVTELSGNDMPKSPDIFVPDGKTSASSATHKVGDPLGDVLYSDITAYINGQAIPTSVINGKTLVVVEDLAKYGFDVKWNGTEKTLKVELNKGKKFNPITTKKDTTNKPGTFKEKYVYTDIKTYISGEEVECYAIKGVTLIDFDALGKFGKFAWDAKTREIKLTVD